MFITGLSATRFILYNNMCDKLVAPRQMRKIKPTRRSVSGVFPFRGEVSVPYESTLERDFIIRREFNRLVLQVIPQPVQIPFEVNGRSYTYTPDFLVYYRTDDYPWACGMKPLLVEVKERSELRASWQKLKPKFRAALRFAKENGWNFRVHDEYRIRDLVFENIRFLSRYKRMEFQVADTHNILGTLSTMGQAPFHYLVSRHFNGKYDSASGIAHIWHLLATNNIECDMTLPLTHDTVLWLPCPEIPTYV